MTSQAIKPKPVRCWLYCSQESFNLLAELGERWLECPASQQSNIVNEVEQLADAAQRRAPVEYLKHRTNWAAGSSLDAARLRRVIAAWPALSHRQQAELGEQIQTVVGK